MARRDDDALSWDGDDDPTLDTGVAAPLAAEPDGDPATAPGVEPAAAPSADAAPPALPVGFTAVGKSSETVGRVEADGSVTPAGAAAPLGNAALITLGILGGVYALWTIGWIVGGLRLQGTAEFLVAPLAYQISLWLAILAPAIWFTSVFVLTRGARTWLRVVWLVAGAVLLVPWPFVMIGAVGQ